jgi:hypothetical protein
MESKLSGTAWILFIGAQLLSAAAYGAALPKGTLQFHSNDDIAGGCRGITYTECVERFLRAPVPGVDSIMLSDRRPDSELKALIEEAHALGLSVGSGVASWTPEEQTRDAQRLARLGFDWLEADELFIRGMTTARDFNSMSAAAKKEKPDILIGITETPTSALGKALAEGARPDFIVNEVYADTPGEIGEAAALSRQYGIPAGTWLDDSGVGGHSLKYACDALKSGLSLFYFNAGGYFDKAQSAGACSAAPGTLALSPIPDAGAGQSVCPGSDAAHCQAFLNAQAFQQQALAMMLGIPFLPGAGLPGDFAADAQAAEGGPIFSAFPMANAPAQAPQTGSGDALLDGFSAFTAQYLAQLQALMGGLGGFFGTPADAQPAANEG